jgi:hypothetical protein
MNLFSFLSTRVLPVAFAIPATASADDSTSKFWDSVYKENHVVEIDIALTKEAWEKMQPAQGERGGRGPRGGEPRGEGRPDRPPRGDGGRPSGPPPGGRPSGPPPGGGGGGTDFEYVTADITIDGEKFADTGLRFKGNSSYRSAADGRKRPFKIDTNRPWASSIPLLERLFATEQFPKLYQKKLKALIEDTFTEKHLFSRIATFEKALKPHLNKEELAHFQKGIQGNLSGQNTASGQDAFAIKPFIKQRIASIKSQLAGKSKGSKIEGRRGPVGSGSRGGPPSRDRRADLPQRRAK